MEIFYFIHLACAGEMQYYLSWFEMNTQQFFYMTWAVSSHFLANKAFQTLTGYSNQRFPSVYKLQLKDYAGCNLQKTNVRFFLLTNDGNRMTLLTGDKILEEQAPLNCMFTSADDYYNLLLLYNLKCRSSTDQEGVEQPTKMAFSKTIRLPIINLAIRISTFHLQKVSKCVRGKMTEQ